MDRGANTRIFFRVPEHKQRFLAAIQDIDKVYSSGTMDQEYAAAIYILTSDAWTWDSAKKYVSSRGIRFDLILEKLHLSSGYAVLIQFAANLFGHDIHIDPVELMQLDDTNFTIALAALQLRRYAFSVEALSATE